MMMLLKMLMMFDGPGSGDSSRSMLKRLGVSDVVYRIGSITGSLEYLESITRIGVSCRM